MLILFFFFFVFCICCDGLGYTASRRESMDDQRCGVRYDFLGQSQTRARFDVLVRAWEVTKRLPGSRSIGINSGEMRLLFSELYKLKPIEYLIGP